MPEISYQDMISSIKINDTVRKAQVENILSQVQSTYEGQLMFQRIQQAS